MEIVSLATEFLERLRAPIAITSIVFVFSAVAYLMLRARFVGNLYRYRHPLTSWMFDQSEKREKLEAERDYYKRTAKLDFVAYAVLIIGVAMAAALFLIS